MMEGNLSIEVERATQAKIEAQLTEARRALAECDARREALAFGAVTGDAASKKALTSLDAEEVRLSLSVRTAEKALVEAKRRVARAEAAERDAAECVNAEKALALLDRFAKHGEVLDERLAEVLAEYEQMEADYRTLEALGFPPTTSALVRVNMRAAFTTKLMPAGLAGEFLAPGDRRMFGGVIEDWTRSVRRRATERLGRNAPQKAA
jgi:chromosome segregation ATPase